MPLSTVTNIWNNFLGNFITQLFRFKLKKNKVIRVIMGIWNLDSRREIFIKNLTILLSIFFSLLLFVIENNEIFPTHSEIHSICTGHSDNLHPPTTTYN